MNMITDEVTLLVNILGYSCSEMSSVVKKNKKKTEVKLRSLRTDTGGLSLDLRFFLDYIGIIVARILYNISYERSYFSLSNDLVIRKFRQKILKMDI